jgi:hypothetical protein
LVPPSTEAQPGQSIEVPRDICDAVEARLAVTGDKALLPRLCELLRVHDHLRVSDKVKALAGQHYGAAYFHDRSTSIATRRRRIARIQEANAAACEAFVEAFRPALEDDYEFTRSEAGRAALAFFSASMEASRLLEEEEAGYRAEEEAKRLAIPGRGYHARAAGSPVPHFLILAEILWMQEMRTPPQPYNSDYCLYRQLLWELVTGEPERSFAKAVRAGRTRHKL